MPIKTVAAAYRALFVAADGGALGIFTAIHRLRAVEKRLRKPLGDAGLLLLAQHVTEMDPATREALDAYVANKKDSMPDAFT